MENNLNKLILIILDGWGLGKDYPGNVIRLANTPNFDKLMREYPNSQLIASGNEVGLPAGQMGNSEVGHMNIGSGRIIFQDLSKISNEIENGKFYENKVLTNIILKTKEKSKKLHLMGLLSSGGVHSHYNHLVAILKLCKKLDFSNVAIHCFTDGRDVSPTTAIKDIANLEKDISQIGVGEIASICGRFYAMDRDKRWDRTKQTYDVITKGDGHKTDNPIQYLKDSYDKNITDEFIEPCSVINNGKITKVSDGDSFIFINFRPDRARQLTRAFVDDDFDGFDRKKFNDIDFVTMTQYDKTIQNVDIAYPKQEYNNVLGQIISKKGLKQLRIAETEKYAHVTFFFNGGIEKEFDNEDRILVPSPKVSTYDLKPEMSAIEVKNHVVDVIKKDIYDLIILNFANSDMVGHTGIIPADKIAVETVDRCLGDILNEIDSNGKYYALITADHGNSEYLIDEKTGGPFTAHTTNPVPLIEYPDKSIKLNNGLLSDIAPTILELMKIEQPSEMTGKSLIKKEK
ncbi:2,3-bisphosphoglycerate-independent phosphoglycerate mutase [uncultured Finegoldia sp.]|uniref:2,3-bisphosphoglycerate-independent phosphoglycerate mutase n=1 Tax=uncultured Finegoldia sp. TaxID=328009 RepID=UPI00261CCEFA|nr:2,3-bisphosphoglycerate-independent phosphoglycerate mutase [uncultured Finegoldia sp.]